MLRLRVKSQQGIMLTGVVYTIAAAQLMKMIYVSEARRVTDTAKTDLASSSTMITMEIALRRCFHTSLATAVDVAGYKPKEKMSFAMVCLLRRRSLLTLNA